MIRLVIQSLLFLGSASAYAANSFPVVNRGNASGPELQPLPNTPYHLKDTLFRCTEGPSAGKALGYRSILRFKPQAALVEFTDPCTSGHITVPFKPDQLQMPRNYTGEAGFLVYEGGLYVSAADMGLQAWCRSRDAGFSFGTDVLVRTDLVTYKTTGHIWISNGTGRPDPDFRQVWEVMPFEVNSSKPATQQVFEAGDGFNLLIEQKQKPSHPDEFEARLDSVLDHQPFIRRMFCRVPGFSNTLIRDKR